MSTQKTLSPIQLPNVSAVVYDVLRHQILSGALLPGQQLNIREIETQLDVSRTPLKLALERLQVEGLISVHPRKGTYVTTFSSKDLQECFEVRIALEAQALRHAFAPANQGRLAHIISLLDDMDAYFRDEATWLDELIPFMDCDRVAHVLMIALADNARFNDIYERANVQGFIAVMGTHFTYGDTCHTQAEHRAINAALRAKDLDTLLRAAREHLEQAGARALQRLSEREGQRS
jgi:DNA-binding GntR family transcriptional regulator